MLIDIDNKFYNNVLVMSEALDCTPEEVLKQQFYTNNPIKQVLLSERDDFTHFVINYRKIIDDLKFLSDGTDYYLSQVDNPIAMKKVFLELGTLLEEDMNFITKLYFVYKEQNKDK